MLEKRSGSWYLNSFPRNVLQAHRCYHVAFANVAIWKFWNVGSELNTWCDGQGYPNRTLWRAVRNASETQNRDQSHFDPPFFHDSPGRRLGLIYLRGTSWLTYTSLLISRGGSRLWDSPTRPRRKWFSIVVQCTVGVYTCSSVELLSGILWHWTLYYPKFKLGVAI